MGEIMKLSSNNKQAAVSICGACSLALLVPTPAATQDAEPAYVIEEIVTTAQKREENLQEVPIAITALGAADIEDRGIKSIQDLWSSVPGVTGYEAPSSRGNLGLNLRGIGSGNASNLSIDPANAVYVDGVYLGKAMGLGVDQIDLERIEILRGPQGTLYGRNSTGGAVNFVTRKPQADFGLELQATAGDYGLKEYRVRLDAPISDSLQTSLSYQTRERDPLYGNTAGGDGFENIDRDSFRAALRWQPTDTVTLDYAFDHSEIDENTQALNMVSFNPAGAGVLAANGFPANTTINSTNRYSTIAAMQGGFQQLLTYGLLPSMPQTTQFNQWMIDWMSWADANAVGAMDRDGYMGSAESVHRSINDHDGHSLTLTWDLGDVEFKSITGWRTMYNVNQSDLDGQDNTVDSGVIFHGTLQAIAGAYFAQYPGIPAAVQFMLANSMMDQMNARGRAETYNSHQINDYEQFSQELQLVGSTDTLDYAAGLFFFNDEGVRKANSLATFPVSNTFANDYENGTDSWSAYSQVTWTPSADSAWAITGGLRYTEEDKSVTQLHRSNAFPGAFVGAFFGGVPFSALYTDNIANPGTMPEVAGVYGRSYSQNFDNLSGKFSVGYRFSDRVNGYFSASTGYRSGGYNGEAFDAANNRAMQVGEESITSYEIGLKADLLDGRMRLNSALFTYTYEDQQISTLSEENGVVTSRLANAGETARTGLEVELTLRPLEDLLLSLAYTYLDTNHKEYPPLIASAAAGGAALEQVGYVTNGLMPENQLAFNADWTIAETEMGLWQLNINGTRQGETFPIGINGFVYDTNGDRMPDTPVIHEQIPLEERTLVNARLALNEISIGDGSLSIGIWGRNLTDEEFSAFAFNFGAGLGMNQMQFSVPRTYGVDLIFRY